MPEWRTYSLRDFVMFSPRTYYRLLELYNAQVWPGQLVALALGVGLLILLRREVAWRGRAIAALLAVCWLQVAYGYLLERYTTINWAGQYFALAFGLQALLLVAIGTARGRLPFSRTWAPIDRAALCLFVFALLVQPLIAPIVGRGWRQAEVFGIAPDPTAIGTLGLLLLSAARVPWILFVVPVGWCAVSAATIWVMAPPDALVLPVATLFVVFLAAWKTASSRRSMTARDRRFM